MDRTRVYTFSGFIEDEIRKNGSSLRAFARRVGIAHGTISNWINEDSPKPELAQLIKLSEVTGVSLETIIGLAYPDVVKKTALSPTARLLAQQFERLGDDVKESILALIRGSK